MGEISDILKKIKDKDINTNVINAFFAINYNLTTKVTDIKQVGENVIIVIFENNVSIKLKFNPVIERFELLEVKNIG